MKNNFIFIGFALLFVYIAAILNHHDKNIQESITYFPIDPKISFREANTTITLLKKAANGQYTYIWKLTSTLDRKAYLRQDAGLLFSNGRLTAVLRGWEQNTDYLKQEKMITAEQSGILQAIAFHYAELHHHNQIFSSQRISSDQLYVINPSAGYPLHSFRSPSSKEEQEWKNRLDTQTSMMLHYSWERGIRFFSINPDQYDHFPLTELNEKKLDSLAGLSKNKTKAIIGRLWEGLYKNYLLGIKKADGTIEKPIGSTVPLILISTDKTHLLVLTESAQGESILLRQMIEYEH